MTLDVAKPTDPKGVTLEAWAQGYMAGSLIVMACIAVANMRKHVLLHKLIVVELLLGFFHGTFIFTNPPVYNWYLSTTAILLNISWSLHNVIAWIKNKPFLGKKASMFYIGTVILVQPYWILEIVANFLYFNGQSRLFTYTRPYEALFRDPWWIYTTASLLWNIKSRYEFGYLELMRVSPRFGVLLGAMMVSVGFIIVDILHDFGRPPPEWMPANLARTDTHQAVTHVLPESGLPDGINPFWKLAFVFKCLSDTMVLDDFKTALDRLKQYKMDRMGSVLSDGVRGDFEDVEQARAKKAERMPNLVVDSVFARDWSKPGEDSIDLESALQMERPREESSWSSKPG